MGSSTQEIDVLIVGAGMYGRVTASDPRSSPGRVSYMIVS